MEWWNVDVDVDDDGWWAWFILWANASFIGSLIDSFIYYFHRLTVKCSSISPCQLFLLLTRSLCFDSFLHSSCVAALAVCISSRAFHKRGGRRACVVFTCLSRWNIGFSRCQLCKHDKCLCVFWLNESQSSILQVQDRSDCHLPWLGRLAVRRTRATPYLESAADLCP